MPSIFLVDSPGDSGFGTLRQAILNVNADTYTGVDVIDFSISSGQQTITPMSPLPTITHPVFIDGTTQWGYAGTPLIQLNGSRAGTGDGLDISAGDSTVRGLDITYWAQDGILLEGNGGDVVVANYIGTDFTGTQGASNAGNGVEVQGAGGDRIGGDSPSLGNLLSANSGDGLLVGASGNVIEGNYIGTDPTGSLVVGNAGNGMEIDGSGNTVGGISAAARNVISANSGDGILVNGSSGGSASNNVVEGNYIGTQASGEASLGNGGNGVVVLTGTNNQIGGTIVAARNVISGNSGYGVVVTQNSTGNVVEGNYLGTDATGEKAIGNAYDGLTIYFSFYNTIGGTTATTRNLVSGNPGGGMDLSGSSQYNLVEGNYVGIDATGKLALTNGGDGISMENAGANTFGGTTPGAGNIISGNGGDGFGDTSSYGELLEGNYIGTDAAGHAAVPNAGDGVRLQGGPPNVTIGGTTAGAGNIISANGGNGIEMRPQTNGAVIQGNYIGTNVTGKQPMGNGGDGVFEFGAGGTVIGGSVPGAGNLIVANKGDGLDLDGGYSTLVEGNDIGTNATGTLGLGNLQSGVAISNGENNDQIGGAVAGARNVISANGGDGVLLAGPNNLVQGNYIGTDATGTRPRGNQSQGLEIDDANNTVGGTTALARNVISANLANGVIIKGVSGIVCEGNYVGTNATGSAALANGGDGVELLEATGDQIGGTATGAGNLISGNSGNGLSLSQESNGNVVEGNFIGTDANGKLALGNGGSGVTVALSSANTIGGLTSAASNVISANRADGVQLTERAADNVLQGNFIGTDVVGINPLGNGEDGVAVSGSRNVIGGEESGAGNTIAFNRRTGVLISSGTGDLISANSIFSNHHLGIVLNTANDANNSQAAPVLTSAVSSGGTTTVQGTLTSTANTTFTIEFFSSTTADPSGFGQGQTFLGSITVTTDGSGFVSFTATIATATLPGQFITATATDPNNDTSAFSNAVQTT